MIPEASWDRSAATLAAWLLAASVAGAMIFAAPAHAWRPEVGGTGSLGLVAEPVRPGETSVVGVIGFGAPVEASPVALTMRPLSGYLEDGQGHSIPVARLEWAFRRHPSEGLSFRPLESGATTVYQGTGDWAGELIFRFRPTWADVASPNAYRLAVEYTMSPTTVDTTPVVAFPNPYDTRSGQSLNFYVYRRAAGTVRVAVWRQNEGVCTGAVVTQGRVLSVQPGWNRLEWAASRPDFPVRSAGFYCYAVSDPMTQRVLGAGGLHAVDGPAGGGLSVRVTAGAAARPLRGAFVGVGEPGKGPGRSSITGEDGMAHFASLGPGRYRVVAEAPGYMTVEKDVSVPADRAEAGDPVWIHLPAVPGPRLAVVLRPPPGRRRVAAGDVVDVELSVTFPPGPQEAQGASVEGPLAGAAPGCGEARIELELDPGLLVLPASWETDGGSSVRPAPEGLVWELAAPVCGQTPTLKARAVVTPLVAGQRLVVARATGSVARASERLSLAPAEARLDLDPADAGSAGLVVGRVQGASDSTAGHLYVVAEDGSFVGVDDGGLFIMTLPAGLHVLWVEGGVPGSSAPGRGGPPSVLLVEPGAVAPIVLAAPGQPGTAGEEAWRGSAVAAGRLQWAQGGDLGGDAGVTLQVARGGVVATASGRVFAGGASPAGGASLERVVFSTPGHLVTVGRVAWPGQPVAAVGGSEAVGPLGDESILGPVSLPDRGVAWRWAPDDGQTGQQSPGRGAVAFFSLDGGFAPSAGNGKDEQNGADGSGGGARTPRALVQAADAGSQGRVWAGVRLDPEGPTGERNTWVAGAGWDGAVGARQVAVEFIQGSNGNGWAARVEARQPARTQGVQLLLRHLTGALAEQAPQPSSPAVVPGMAERTELEWRLAPGDDGAGLRGAGFGVSWSRAADVYAVLDLAMPVRAVSGVTAVEAVTVAGRLGAVVDATAAIRPYAETSLALPALRMGTTKIAAGGRLRAGDVHLAGIRPVQVWAELSARPHEALGLGAKASLETGWGREGQPAQPQFRLRGEVAPGGALRFSTQALAASSRLQWEQVSASFEGPGSRVEVRVTPGYLEAEAALHGPATLAGSRAGPGAPWRLLSASVRWPARSTMSGGRLEIRGGWAGGPLAMLAEVKHEARTWEVVASASADVPGFGAPSGPRASAHPEAHPAWAGPLTVYGSTLWRRVVAFEPGVRVDTSVLRLGARGSIGKQWGWFSEAGAGLVREEVEDVYRAAHAAAGVYVELPAESGSMLVEGGWRALTCFPEPQHPERLAPELQPGLFVRLNGWWAGRLKESPQAAGQEVAGRW